MKQIPSSKFDDVKAIDYDGIAGWSSLVARWAHNPKVGGSNPPPATKPSEVLFRKSPRLLKLRVELCAWIS